MGEAWDLLLRGLVSWWASVAEQPLMHLLAAAAAIGYAVAAVVARFKRKRELAKMRADWGRA